VNAGRYAEGTSVPVTRSRDEIAGLLARYGAHGFGWYEEDHTAQLAFKIGRRTVRIDLPLPRLSDAAIKVSPKGKLRTDSERDALVAAETRRRWRALALVIKAKLEAVSSGISTLEREFLADLVLQHGETFHQWVRPQLEAGDAPAPPARIAGMLGPGGKP
jgi:hypothetical protein